MCAGGGGGSISMRCIGNVGFNELCTASARHTCPEVHAYQATRMSVYAAEDARYTQRQCAGQRRDHRLPSELANTSRVSQIDIAAYIQTPRMAG